MAILSAKGTLQTATTIAKTTPTIMGAEIACSGYSFITLFFDYVKGDETGVDIYPYFRQASGGTNYQEQDWTAVAGTRAATVKFVVFYQGGSNNDGTPTGTLAATYTMTAE